MKKLAEAIMGTSWFETEEAAHRSTTDVATVSIDVDDRLVGHVSLIGIVAVCSSKRLVQCSSSGRLPRRRHRRRAASVRWKPR